MGPLSRLLAALLLFSCTLFMSVVDAGQLLALSIETEETTIVNTQIKVVVVGLWNIATTPITVTSNTFDPRLTITTFRAPNNNIWSSWLATTDMIFTVLTQDSTIANSGWLLGKCEYLVNNIVQQDSLSFRVTFKTGYTISQYDTSVITTLSTTYYTTVPSISLKIEGITDFYRNPTSPVKSRAVRSPSLADNYYIVYMQVGRSNMGKDFGMTFSSTYGTNFVLCDTQACALGYNWSGNGATVPFRPSVCYVSGQLFYCSFSSSTALNLYLPTCLIARPSNADTSTGGSDQRSTYFCFLVKTVAYTTTTDPLPPTVVSGSYTSSQYSVDSAGTPSFTAQANVQISFQLRAPAYSEYGSNYGVKVSLSGGPTGYTFSSTCAEGTGNVAGYSPAGQPCTMTFTYTPRDTGEYWTVSTSTWSSNLQNSASGTVRIISVPPPPAITSIDPTTGPTSGVVLTIYGTNLGSGITDPNWVTVGGVQCTSAVYSSSRLTCNIQAGVGTNRNVVVSVSGQSSTQTFYFSFNAPTFTSTSSTSDVSSGGASSGLYIIITGTNFGNSVDNAVFTIGGVAATITDCTHTSITLQSPRGCGTNLAQVLTIAGRSPSTTLPVFSYAAPSLTAIASTSKPTEGGPTLTLFGSSFCTNAVSFSVTVGTQACSSSNGPEHTDTSLTCTLPAGSGTVTVSLTVNGRTSASTVSLTYDPPVISSLTPSTLTSAGGLVTIAGSNFWGSSSAGSTISVTFRGVSVPISAGYTYNQAIVTIPNTIVASGNIAVTTSGQTSISSTLTISGATISSILPALQSTAGGVSITITGTSLGSSAAGSVTSLTLGGLSCTVTSQIATQLIFTLPASQGANLALVLRVDDSTVSSTYSFGAPTITGLTPSTITSASALITIDGTNFGASSAGSVTINSASCSMGTGTSWTHTRIICLRPAGSGTGNTLVVSAASQTASTTFNIAAPSISAVAASNSETRGGGILTLTGTSFTTSGTVSFGGTTFSSLSWSHTEVTMTLPVGFGANTVYLRLADGSTVSNSVTFSYSTATISSITCSSPVTAGGTSLVLAGYSFDTGGSVHVGSAVATSCAWGHSSITCTLPAGQGTVNVYVVTVSGVTSNTLTLTYTAPVISSINPTSMNTEANIDLVVTGTNFGTTGAITLGSTTCTLVSRSQTQITCTVPPLTSASSLTTAFGVVTVSVGGQVGYGPTLQLNVPVITSISPTTSDTPGGTLLTINGNSFGVSGSLSADILVGSAVCTSPTRTHTQIVCTIPAGTGSQSVSVTVVGLKSNTSTLAYNAPVLASITPLTDIDVGNLITLVGTNFGTVGSVLVSQSICVATSYTHTQIVCAMPDGAGTNKPTYVKVGSLSSNSIDISYLMPTITNISPTSASSAGGSSLTVNGVAFGNSGIVFVGSQTCPFSSYSPTRIICTLPAGAGVNLATSVTTESGQTSNSVTFSYSLPSITSISPTVANTSGQVITITGTSFGSSGSINIVATYGTVLCAMVNSADWTDSQIICTLSAGVGTLSISVTVNVYTSNAVNYAYGIPVINSVAPSCLSTAGTDALTITGSNFGGSSMNGGVTVNGVNCAMTGGGRRDTRIECSLPAGQGVDLAIVVTAGGQTNSGSSLIRYCNPSISSVVFGGRGTGGTDEITISGSNFGLNSQSVAVGSNSGVIQSFTHSEIVSTLPCGKGTSQSLVVNVGSQASSAFTFSYSRPAVTSLGTTCSDDVLCPTSGNRPVTIIGTNLAANCPTVTDDNVPTVSIGGANCPVDRSSLSPTFISCTLPAGTGFEVPVVVTLGGQTQAENTVLSYQIPTVTAVSPSSLPSTIGNTMLTITGQFFATSGTQVRYAMVASDGTHYDFSCTPVTFNTATSIECVTAPGFGGNLKVSVYDSLQWGPWSSVLVHYPAPVLTAGTLRLAGGTGTTTMVGSNSYGDIIEFDISNGGSNGAIGRSTSNSDISKVKVYFGPLSNLLQYECGSVAYLTDLTGLSCQISPGIGDNLVFTIDINGVQTTGTDTYSYPPSPVITSISGCPQSSSTSTWDCPTAGGTLLTITGTGYPQANLEIYIDNQRCTTIGTPSSTSAICRLPAHVGADLLVIAKNTNNPESILESQPVYLVSYIPPAVASVSGCTDSGSSTIDCNRNGGTSLTIFGSNFGLSGALAYLCNTLCEPLTHDSLTPHEKLVCTMPPGVALNGEVMVIAGSQSSTSPGLISYARCPAGKYEASNTDYACTNCDAGRFSSAPSQVVCTPCSDGSYQGSTGATFCPFCAVGRYSVRQSDTTGAVACTNCPVGSVSAFEGQFECSACLPGTYQGLAQQTSCVACAVGTATQDVGSQSCVSCVAGRFAQSTGSVTCDACIVGTYSSSGASICVNCPTGRVSPNPAASGCIDCSPGSYSPVVAQAVCVQCDGGTYTDTVGQSVCAIALPGQIAPKSGSSGAITATSCSAGTYSAAAGQTICVQCIPGKIAAASGASVCDNCAAGTYSSSYRATQCLSCSPGTYSGVAGAAECSFCVVGRYTSSSGLTVCTRCAPGTIAAAPSAASCTDCLAGSYADVAGLSFCKDCDLGMYADVNAMSACLRCSPGEFAPNVGLTSCTDASPGYYVPTSSQGTQYSCPPGRYSTGNRNVECFDCPAGSWTANSATASCTTALPGTFSILGDTKATDCLPGTYQPSSGQSLCLICGEGRYSSSTQAQSCTVCASGTFNSLPGMALCLLCGSGTYTALSDGNTFCTDCDVGYYQPQIGQDVQILCPVGTFNPTTGQAYCAPCPEGYFAGTAGTTECSICGAGTYSLLGASVCVDCDFGSMSALPGSNVCLACEAGKYQDNSGQSACVDCPQGRVQPALGTTSCVNCEQGYIQAAVGQLSCEICQVGKFWVNTYTCTNCDAGTFSASTGALACVDCIPGRFSSVAGEFSCTACPSGYISAAPAAAICDACPVGRFSTSASSTECVDCAAGSYASATATVTCTLCEEGRYIATVRQVACTVCTAGTYCPRGAVSMLDCPVGSFNPLEQQAACAVCPVGTFASVTALTVCVDCDLGRAAKLAGSTGCELCVVGKFASSVAMVNCVLCDLGKYSNSPGLSACMNCDPGYFQPYTGRSICESCAAGTYTAVSGQQFCAVCPKGYFQGSPNAIECDACAIGRFQAETGSTNCEDCRPGRATQSIGQPVCADCLPGSVSSSFGSTSCTACAIGTYMPEFYNEACLPCPVGSSTDLTGQAECAACPAGRSQSLTGQTDCDECGAGKYQVIIGQSACEDCLTGRFIPTTGALECAACDPGQFQATRGRTECDDCDIGRYRSQQGGSDCTDCPVGSSTAATASTGCDLCVVGRFADTPGNAVSCSACPSGRFASTLGSSVCTLCPPGSDGVGQTGLAQCISCVLGKFSADGSVCTNCPAGRYSDVPGLVECNLCPIGTFNSYLGGAISCVACAPGTFADVTGLNACENCAAGKSISTPGQTSCVDCAVGKAVGSASAVACIDCAPGLNAPITGMTGCVACTQGRYATLPGAVQCLDCQTGRATNAFGSANCDGCAPGSFGDVTGLTSCLSCPGGKYTSAQSQIACIMCDVGKFSTGGAIVCDDCSIGYSVASQGASVCEACVPGRFQSVRGHSSCNLCALGTFTQTSASVACEPCGAGTFSSSEGALTCVDCPRGQYRDSSHVPASSCDSCPLGKFSSGEGSIMCTDCPLGTSANVLGKVTCDLCAAGRAQANEGQSNCDPCPVGTATLSLGLTLCGACPQGRFTDNTGNVECTACAEGMFQDETGRSECQNCASGKFQRGTGSLKCDDCPSGSYSNIPGLVVCVDCPLGTYQDSQGATVCFDCGTTVDANGVIVVLSNLLGRHAPVEGLSTCQDCSVGRFANETGLIECTLCPVGSYQSVRGSTECAECREGTFGGVPGLQSCVVCDAGSYQPLIGQTVCTFCPPGSHSAPNSRVACVDCLVGKYQPSFNQAECLDCPPGTSGTTIGATDCDACSVGMFQPNEGQTRCDLCAPGKSSPNPHASLCSDCPPGSYQPSVGSTLCLDCAPGYAQSRIQSTSCSQCASGTYSPGGIPECFACGAGTISAATGQSDCTVCPAGTQPNPSANRCLCLAGTAAQFSLDNATGLVVTTCVPCPEGAVCDTDGMEWEFLVASPGYWQAPETDNFYRCLIATQCTGGSADANETQCAANRVGPLCAQCANGYSESVSGACEVCEDTTGGIIGTVFVAVVAGAILYLNYFIILESTRNLIDASIAEDKRITKQQTLLKAAEKELTQKYTAEGKTPAEIKQLVKTEVQVLKKKKFVASDFTAADEDGYSRYEGQLTIHGPPSPKAEFTYKLKILLGFMQILSNVSTALEIQWPQSFIDFLQLFNPFQLDFLKYANVDCIAKDYNFFFAMYAWVLLPPVVILLLVVFYLLPGYRRFPAKTEKAHRMRKARRRQFWRLVCFTLFLIYPSVSSTILRTYVCEDIEGIRYLQSDFSITCDTAEWQTAANWAGFFTVLYPIGIPTLFLYLLYSYRAKLDLKGIRSQLGFLYDGYCRDVWWFELLDMVHKLTLTSLIAFLPAVYQLQCAMGVCFVYLAIILMFNPYIRKGDDRLHCVAQIELICLFQSGHLLNNADPLNALEEAMMSFLLMFMTLGFLAWFVATSLKSAQKFLIAADYKCCKVVCPCIMFGHTKRHGQKALDNEIELGNSNMHIQSKEDKEAELALAETQHQNILHTIPFAKSDQFLPPPPTSALGPQSVNANDKKEKGAFNQVTYASTGFYYQAIVASRGLPDELVDTVLPHDRANYLSFGMFDILCLRPTSNPELLMGHVERSRTVSAGIVKHQGFVRVQDVRVWQI